MRLVYLIPIAVFILLAVILVFTLQGQIDGTIQREQIPSALTARPAPTEVFPNLRDGSVPLDIQEHLGGALLVNFFASWCVPCRAEMPLLDEISDEITLIGITYKDRIEDTEKFLERFGNPFVTIGVDMDGLRAIPWGLYGIPETFLIDKDGKVLFRHAGALTRDLIKNTLRPMWQNAS